MDRQELTKIAADVLKLILCSENESQKVTSLFNCFKSSLYRNWLTFLPLNHNSLNYKPSNRVLEDC